METSTLTRAALGSSAALGDLYDARLDDFTGVSIFKKTVFPSAVTVRDSHFSDIHLMHSEDFSEKTSKLDVGAQLSVSALAGLFSLSGAGRYLNDHKTSSRTVKSSLIYNIKTKEESINFFHEDLKDAFSIDAIESGTETHVVVGISWGANSILSFTNENKENVDSRRMEEIKANLAYEIKKCELNISANVRANSATNSLTNKNSGDSTENTSTDTSGPDPQNADNNATTNSTGNLESKSLSFGIKMYGDVLPGDEQLPATLEGALALMKKVPSLVAASNEGRGKPLTYRLMPLSRLQAYLKLPINSTTTVKRLEEPSALRIIQLFDQMNAAHQRVNDFHQDIQDFKWCVNTDDLLEIGELQNEMATQKSSFKSKLANLLTEIRSGKIAEPVLELETLLSEIRGKAVLPHNVVKRLAVWNDVVEKINFAKTVVKMGVVYVGEGVHLGNEILKDYSAKSYIFYFSMKGRSKDIDRWEENKKLFFQKINENEEGSRYFVVDCDIHQELIVSTDNSCVQVVQAGETLVRDLLEESKKPDWVHIFAELLFTIISTSIAAFKEVRAI